MFLFEPLFQCEWRWTKESTHVNPCPSLKFAHFMVTYIMWTPLHSRTIEASKLFTVSHQQASQHRQLSIAELHFCCCNALANLCNKNGKIYINFTLVVISPFRGSWILTQNDGGGKELEGYQTLQAIKSTYQQASETSEWACEAKGNLKPMSSSKPMSCTQSWGETLSFKRALCPSWSLRLESSLSIWQIRLTWMSDLTVKFHKNSLLMIHFVTPS